MGTRYQAKRLRRHYIFEHMTAHRFNQRQLADEMDTSETNVSRWIAQPWRVDLNVLSGVADALGIKDAGDLLRPPGNSAKSLLERAIAALPPEE